MPYQRLAEAVLAQWRALERRIEVLDPFSPEADVLKAESYRLCNRYQELIALAVARYRPAPPPFPEPDHPGDGFDFSFVD